MLEYGIPCVLIVDDDPETLEIMKNYLIEECRVGTVMGGRQAIEYVQQNHVDVILLDVEMPIMDGFKTLEQLRNMSECINVPIILVTGRNDRYTVLTSLCRGIDGYLVKPVDKGTILAKIQEVLLHKSVERNKKTVLAIDDDMAYLKLVRRYLQDEYNVVMINSARLAMEYLIKNIPDVVLLDYQMPLYSGSTVMNMLQRHQDTQNIPVIILTGCSDAEAVKECILCNPAGYLVKPVDKETLCETIEKVLAKRYFEE